MIISADVKLKTWTPEEYEFIQVLDKDFLFVDVINFECLSEESTLDFGVVIIKNNKLFLSKSFDLKNDINNKKIKEYLPLSCDSGDSVGLYCWLSSGDLFFEDFISFLVEEPLEITEDLAPDPEILKALNKKK